MFWEGWSFLAPFKSEKILEIGKFPYISDSKLESCFHEKFVFLKVDESDYENYSKINKFLESFNSNDESIDCIFINADLLKINFEKLIEKCISILKSKGMIFIYTSRNKIISTIPNERNFNSFFFLGLPRPNSILIPDGNLGFKRKILEYIQQIKYRNKRFYYFFYLLRFLNSLNLFGTFFRHRLFVFVNSESSINPTENEKNSCQLLTKEDSSFGILPVKRKNIVTEFSNDGSLEKIYKFSSGKQGKEIVSNEAKMLEYLASYEFDKAIVPKVINYHVSLERSYLEISVQSELKYPKKMGEIHVDWLIELFSKTSTLSVFRDSLFFSEIQEKLKVINHYFKEGSNIWLNQLCEEMVAVIDDLNLPFGVVQREFPFYHANMIGGSEKMFVFDWEFSRVNYPPLFDLFHCMLSDKHISGAESVPFPERVIKTLFFSKQAQVFFKKYIKELNLPTKVVYPLFVLFLIDQLACYLPFVERLEEVDGYLDALQEMKNKSSFSFEQWMSDVSI